MVSPIDEPGPWGTGPFTLVQGASSVLTRNVIMSPDPYTCSWLIELEDRTPEVVLEANLDHWNRAARGPAHPTRCVPQQPLPLAGP
jgi:peptide/nickel transport system substrate-binding protein